MGCPTQAGCSSRFGGCDSWRCRSAHRGRSWNRRPGARRLRTCRGRRGDCWRGACRGRVHLRSIRLRCRSRRRRRRGSRGFRRSALCCRFGGGGPRTRSTWGGSRCSWLRGCRLRYCPLRCCRLRSCWLRRCRLRRCRLRSCRLRSCRLRSCRLRCCRLRLRRAWRSRAGGGRARRGGFSHPRGRCGGRYWRLKIVVGRRSRRRSSWLPLRL